VRLPVEGVGEPAFEFADGTGGEAPVWVHHGVVAVCDVSRVELGGCRQGDRGPDDRERRSFRVELGTYCWR